jgi:hypothetical protein
LRALPIILSRSKERETYMNTTTATFTATPGPRTFIERVKNVFRGSDAVYACDLRAAVAYINHLTTTTTTTTNADYSAFRMVARPAPAAEEIEEIFEDLVARGLATVRRQPDGKNRYYATKEAYELELQ